MELKDLLETYVKPYTWEGKLTIDGGWGSQGKDVPLNLVAKLQEDGYLISITPKAKLIDERSKQDISELDEIDAILGLDFSKTAQEGEEYLFTFPGEHFKGFVRFVAADLLKGHELVFELNSFSKHEVPKPKEEIFRLNVTRSNGVIVFNVSSGDWVPSFADPVPLEGCIWKR